MIKSSRSYKNYNYICTQYISFSICKANTTIKGEINSNIIIVGDLRHLFCQWADHPGRKLTGNMGLKSHIRPHGLN